MIYYSTIYLNLKEAPALFMHEFLMLKMWSACELNYNIPYVFKAKSFYLILSANI